MAEFVYKMQNILNLRLKEEDMEKQQYRLARLHLNEEEEALTSLYHKKEDLLSDKKESMMGRIRATELAILENAIKSTDISIVSQIKKVKKAERALEEERVKLEEAIKERKKLETLRDNKYAEFLAEENRKEQLEINELVSYRYGVNNG